MSNALVQLEEDDDITMSVVAPFDYTALNTEAAALARTIAAELPADLGRHAETAIVVGAKLNRVKNVLDHGQFLLWLEAESSLSQRTAQRFMRLAEVYGPDIRHRGGYAYNRSRRPCVAGCSGGHQKRDPRSA